MSEGGGAGGESRPSAPASRGYLIAAAATLLALAARVALDPLIVTHHRFALLYAASMMVAARHGLGPGLAVVVLGAFGVAVLSGMSTVSSVVVISPLDLGVFVLISGALAWVAATMKRAREHADASSAQSAAHAAALARSEERYRSFIERSSEGIWRIELERPVAADLPEDEQIEGFYREGWLAECNDAMARMYGFEEARELVGVRLPDLVVPTDPANRDYLRAFVRGGYRVVDGESHERDRYGETKWFLNNLVGTVENGRVVRAWGTQRDVTEMRRTEHALRASEERLRLALAAGRMGIWDWDMVTGAVEWSDDLEALHGLSAGTFGGTYEALLALVHPDDRDGFTTAVRRAIDGAGDYEAEFRVVAPDGTVRWMLGKGRILSDASGRPVRMVGLGVDVTARKEVEDELRRSVARLEQKEQEVQELYGRERDARAEAERSNRTKDEFLATLSHELRSPLSAALSWTHMLRRGQLDAEKTARALDTIERTTRLQVRLIEDLLDISRIVSGKLTLEMGVVDLGAVLDAAVDAARTTADGRRIALDVAPAGEVLLVAGDATRIEQVLANLLGNALKFTPPGGSVTVTARRDAGQAEVTITDTGVGIAPDVLPHVFDRFRQADSSTTRRHGGLGLGLAIARHIVGLHGGTIAAESAGEGRGTSMRVSLPLELGAEEGRPVVVHAFGERGRDPAPLAGYRVLVVDDASDMREHVATALAFAGAEVTSAASASEALACHAADPPNVIVSDLAMPEQDGFDLLRTLRARGATMPVVALTALASAADRQRTLAAGFDAYVTKPVEPPFLVATIARLCRAADAAAASR